MGVFSFSFDSRQFARWTLLLLLISAVCFWPLYLWKWGLCLHAPWISRFVFITFVGSLRIALIVSIHSCMQSWHPSLLNVFIMLIGLPCQITSNLIISLVSLGLGFSSKCWAQCAAKEEDSVPLSTNFWMSLKCFPNLSLNACWVFLMCFLSHDRHVALCAHCSPLASSLTVAQF